MCSTCRVQSLSALDVSRLYTALGLHSGFPNSIGCSSRSVQPRARPRRYGYCVRVHDRLDVGAQRWRKRQSRETEPFARGTNPPTASEPDRSIHWGERPRVSRVPASNDKVDYRWDGTTLMAGVLRNE